MDVFRKEYRKLAEYEISNMNELKQRAQLLYDFISGMGPVGNLESREISLAKTKLEECVMWAVKDITG